MSKISPQQSPLFTSSPRIDDHLRSDSRLVLYPGDTFDLLSKIPDGSARLIISSPPYNLGKAYESRVTIEEYLKSQSGTLAQLARVLADDGSLCWEVGNYVDNGEVYPLDILYYPLFKQLGLKLRNRIIWRFGHGLHASRRFSGRYETILWFTKSDQYVFNLDPVRVPSKYPGKRHFKGPNKGKPSGNPLGKNPSDIWEIVEQDFDAAIWDIPNVKANHPEKTLHPCQFPIELVERCVLAMTNAGDWVLDPYAGVGSTLIAAIKNNRRAIGAEKDFQYVEMARERIESFYAGTIKIRPIGQPIFVPTGRERVSQIPTEWKQP
jgi:adenine-specific DNA-methyltransferase